MAKLILIGCDGELAGQLGVELEGLHAEVEAQFSDVEDAINGLPAALNETRVFLICVKSLDGHVPLKRLNNRFGGHPILALVEQGDDPTLFINANRHGAAQVVPLPLRREDFRGAMHRIGIQFGVRSFRSEIIAIAGVAGGCGATAIAANLAYEVSRFRQGRYLLAELSLQLGNLANYFDVEPPLTTFDLFSRIEQLDVSMVERVMTPIDKRFSIIAGPYRNIAGVSVTTGDVKRVIDYAKQLADVVFLDVPCTLDDHYFEVLSAADRIILVSEQKVPALRSLRAVCDVLDDLDLVLPRILVINRYNPSSQGMSIKRLEGVLKTTGFRTIGNDFAAMNAAIDHGRPLRLEAPRSRLLADIQALAVALFPEIEPVSKKKKGSPFLATLSRCLGFGVGIH